ETLRRGRFARISLARRGPTGAAAVRPAPPPPAAILPEGAPRLRDWIGVLAMGTGLFMAIMDVQIVTSSLTQIQGGLSASTDEIAWVQTAYLIAAVVMVPMSGILSRLLSTRILFVIATLGFTAASALCASATNLDQMILYRAMQGFCAGAITPGVFPVVYTTFRGPQLATLMVIISVILNLSSTLGPTLGGFLTDAFSWHWLFLVNIVPGFLVAAVVWVTIDIDKPDPSLLRHFDLSGLVQMAMSPFSAYIARNLDLRIMLAIGLGVFAYSMYLTAGLTNQASFMELLVPQAVRGFALMFCYLPANLIALSTVPPDKLKNAAGLYNLTRELGGAIVLATIGTIMNDRLHFHWNRLVENINPARPAVQRFLEAQTNRF